MNLDAIREKIERLGGQGPGALHGGDFLLSWKISHQDILAVLQCAEILEDLYAAGIATRTFSSGLGLSIFRDKSTRTRYSFRAACNLLGLGTEELDETTSQVTHGETVRETATMISFLTEVIGIRDDMFLGEGHQYMAEVAESVAESHREGVLAQRPAVVNLQCDLDHPTQSLADLRHLASEFDGFEALRGKKLAMTWAYSPSYGKPLSVPQGVVALATRFGMDVMLAHPPGYDLVEEPLAAAGSFAQETGGSFRVVDSLAEAFAEADVVYPKSWAPRWAMVRRTELLRSGKTEELATLEKEALAENAKHVDWECGEELMRSTRFGKALYLHCLPADVSGVNCASGEVARSVFERYRLATYREASHKPFVIAAIILATRFRDPATVLQKCLEMRRERR